VRQIRGRLALAHIADRHESSMPRQLREAFMGVARAREQRAIEHDHDWARRVERRGRWQRENAPHLDIILASA
jgi:hypothetical protein